MVDYLCFLMLKKKETDSSPCVKARQQSKYYFALPDQPLTWLSSAPAPFVCGKPRRGMLRTVLIAKCTSTKNIC